jgi:hypothetical protein
MTVVLSSCLFLSVISLMVYGDVTYGCRGYVSFMVVNCDFHYDIITSPDHTAVYPKRYNFFSLH